MLDFWGDEMKDRKSKIFARHTDNWYVEPKWVSERLFDVEDFGGLIVDPCAGGGNIISAALSKGLDAQGYDLRDRGGSSVLSGYDFISGEGYLHGSSPFPNIVSNPPYGRHISGRRIEEIFIERALKWSRGKVAVFLETKWANAEKRGAWLETLPLYREYRLGPRPSCPPGEYLLEGNKAGGGTKDYSWFVFLKGFQGSPTLHWLRRGG